MLSYIFVISPGSKRCVTETTLLFWRLSIVMVLGSSLALPALGQAFLFGSLDDPAEQSSIAWWQARTHARTNTGFSLIGPQWRTAVEAEIESHGARTSLLLSGVLRAGVYGAYDPDTDEAYDLLRTVRFARYRDIRKNRYLRIGPLNRTRLGSGHLVNFFSTETARDERTVGAEARIAGRFVEIQAFSEDVLSIGLLGARISVSPFSARSGLISSFSVAASLVTDRRSVLDSGSYLRGQESDIRVEAFRTGGFSFSPFLSFARIPDFGQGLLFGADIQNENFIDLASLHFRLALQYNSSDFQPGYFGSFYTVSSHRAQILVENETGIAGVALSDIKRGNSINTELRLLIFDRFEFWYAFQRYHGVQTLSEYHVRLFFRTDRFKLGIGQDRRGLTGFTSLFKQLGHENRMRFTFNYRLIGPLWVNMDAHYTYLRLSEPSQGREQFIVQRRFSPLVGLQFSL